MHAAPALDGHLDEDEADRWKSSAITRIAARIDELQTGLNVEGTPQVSFGPPARAISMLARSTRADLVVVGRGVSQDLLGRLRATAYDIIRQCPCPVVSI
jgi:nucleotide-binding universal stress UspA family protein